MWWVFVSKYKLHSYLSANLGLTGPLFISWGANPAFLWGWDKSTGHF